MPTAAASEIPAVIGQGADIRFTRSSLVDIQRRSFEQFENKGIKDLLDQIFPIEDTAKTPRFRMVYGDQDLGGISSSPGYELREPKYSERDCRDQGLTYASPLYVRVRLIIKETGEEAEQSIFFGEIPKMTSFGTFIINGAERVVVSQIIRAPGAYFTFTEDAYTKEVFCNFKLIPYRGAWIEAETAPNRVISIKIDRKRKMPITTFMQALGMTKDAIRKEFKDVPGAMSAGKGDGYIDATLERDTINNRRAALGEMYKRLRPSEPTISDEKKAIEFVEEIFFNPRKYDLGAIGRYKVDKKLGRNPSKEKCVGLTNQALTRNDFVGLFKEMVKRMHAINSGEDTSDYRLPEDDVDHLGNRRVRTVGELLQNQLRVGLLRMERAIMERMSTTHLDPERKARLSPAAFINNRPIATAARNFFASSQLSQFMDQTNPLAELTHKRRISAMGTGGLTRERASFDVRDVHYSHYGRLCPIETPEGPNIGLLGSLATFARVDGFGLIQTPYYKVEHAIRSDNSDLIGRTLHEDVKSTLGKTVAKAGAKVDKDLFKKLSGLKRELPVKSFVDIGNPNERVYLSADEEFKGGVAAKVIQAGTALDAKGQIMADKVEVRQGETFSLDDVRNVDYIDYSAIQTVSVTTALIPFLEHDDANRALMGSNMQRQAVPLMKPQAPVVGTGMEASVAGDSGQVAFSDAEGIVTYASSDRIVVTDASGKQYETHLRKFIRSNQGTCINQRPVVKWGQKVQQGDVIADSYSSEKGELALGQNLLVGFMSWEGYNYEDAIIVSEDLARRDAFTSVHIEKHELETRDTKLGVEEMTRDIPNVGEENLRNLDEEGVVRIGAWVEPNDILVGKVSPRGETELTAEEKLLRAIFGDKARDVKDTSKRLPHGQRGKVVDVKVFTREEGHKLPAGVIKAAHVWVAHARHLTTGDKMAGRHGNKGVVAKVLPREDMPFLKDGRRLDIILNPIGVPSRMNLGQLLETYLGWAAKAFGFQSRMPAFQSMSQNELQDYAARAWFVEQSGAVHKEQIDHPVINYDKVDAWLKERGYSHSELWNTAASNRGKAREACLRLWLADLGEKAEPSAKVADLLRKAREIEHIRAIPCPLSGKQILHDGRTGEPFMQPVSVGYVYMMKLAHLAEDKIHARSTGPYSLITQQPLGGKAQFGGQRFGEMEVWALQAYSAAYTLQELLTIKSDDVQGRNEAYDAICRGDLVSREGTPESFQVLVKEMQSLGLLVELLEESPEFSLDDASVSTEIDIEDLDENMDLDEDLLDPEKPLELDGAAEEDW